jgi:hypothetical protein
MSDTFKIVIRHHDEPMATIATLPDRTTLDEARAIYRKYFLEMADDEYTVELWRDEHEALN